MKRLTNKRRKRLEVVRRKREKRLASRSPKRSRKLGRKAGRSKGRVPEAKRHGPHLTVVKIPETFSILDDPSTAINVLGTIRVACATNSTKEIHLDHSRCRRLGLCASVVTDVLLLRARNRRKGNPLILSGTYSGDADVNIMIRATGILHNIKHPESVLPKEIEETIRRSELYSGKASRRERSRHCDMAATSLIDYFNNCLGNHGFELSAEGARDLSALITEVIGNAEEHGGHWYTIGFYRQKRGAQATGECHILYCSISDKAFMSLSIPTRHQVN